LAWYPFGGDVGDIRQGMPCLYEGFVLFSKNTTKF
jgi:hypothetical protein